MLFDYEATRTHLEQAVAHYKKTAPAYFIQYLDGLYVRLYEKPESVSVLEVVTVGRLLEEGEWEHPNYAVNRLYHMMDRLGMDTTGCLDR